MACIKVAYLENAGNLNYIICIILCEQNKKWLGVKVGEAITHFKNECFSLYDYNYSQRFCLKFCLKLNVQYFNRKLSDIILKKCCCMNNTGNPLIYWC